MPRSCWQTANAERVLDLLARKGMLRTSDLDAVEIPRVVLSRMTAAGQPEPVGRGLYRLPESSGSEHESLAAVATKAPRAVF